MESQQLVIDDAVEQLKAARADKQPGPCMQSRDGTGAAQVHEQIEPGGKQQQLRSMQQPGGQEPDGRGRATAEVVPGENLVKQNPPPPSDRSREKAWRADSAWYPSHWLAWASPSAEKPLELPCPTRLQASGRALNADWCWPARVRTLICTGRKGGETSVEFAHFLYVHESPSQ